MDKLSKDMREKARRAERLFAQRLPDKIIREATNLVDTSFEKEQYQDGKSAKWKARKDDPETQMNKAGSRKVARTKRRALLVQSGKLIGSVEVDKRGDQVVIHTDVEYAPVHNEGLQAGRGSGFQMPQRQFMPIEGEEFPAQSEIDDWMDDQLNDIFS